MSSNVVNTIPYLRTSREFPPEIQPLQVELTKSYIDISSAVNARVIGIFPTNRPSITGESWYITNNQKQQTLRQVYPFSSTVAINHNVSVESSSQFINCFGSYTDGTNTYGLFFASSVAIAGQITFYVTATQIIIVTGAGAPALVSGTIVLSWLSSV